jgi:choline kinase
MKSYGPKALIRLGFETVIERQLRLLRSCYPQARFIVVAGFEADRVRKTLPDDVCVLINPDYETTNVARSIEIGLRQCVSDSPALIVYGDLVFNRQTVSGLPLDRSSAILDLSGPGREQEVGINVVGGDVMCFSFGLPQKWAHVCLLTDSEKQLFLHAAQASHRSRFFGYEILNSVLDSGGTLEAISPAGMRLVEIDSSKDIGRARRIDA